MSDKERKPLAVIALGVERQRKGKDAEPEGDDAADEYEGDPGLDSAAEDIADALGVEVKDKAKLVGALEDFVRICSAKKATTK